jgi:hypothetical protein
VLGAKFLLIDEIEGGDLGSAHLRHFLGQRRLNTWTLIGRDDVAERVEFGVRSATLKNAPLHPLKRH